MEKKSVGLLELETAVLECFLEKIPLSPLGVKRTCFSFEFPYHHGAVVFIHLQDNNFAIHKALDLATSYCRRPCESTVSVMEKITLLYNWDNLRCLYSYVTHLVSSASLNHMRLLQPTVLLSNLH
jgi:hypothetical protein